MSAHPVPALQHYALSAIGASLIPAVCFPRLETERLVLRQFSLEDAPMVQRLAGAWEIADTTLHIPHPYPDGLAEQWIGQHVPALQAGEGLTLAIVLREDEALCGVIGLRTNLPHSNAEMGYWVGVPFWNCGLCTEAAGAVLDYAFLVLDLHRVHASHLTRNPASGKVMQKLGMRHEGRFREHIRKWERFENLEQYGILRPEWLPGFNG